MILNREIKYFENKNLFGKIIGIEIQETDNPDIGGYYYYKYAVMINNKTYYANTNKKIILKINDNVICAKKGEKLVRIIFVNGKKAQNKYGLDVYISVSILLLTLLSLIYLIKKQRK